MSIIEFKVECSVCGAGLKEDDVEVWPQVGEPDLVLKVCCSKCADYKYELEQLVSSLEEQRDDLIVDLAKSHQALLAKIEEYEGRLKALQYAYDKGMDTSI